MEKVDVLEATQGYALCEQWEESADAFVHSQSICELNTGERGIEGEEKEIFTKSTVNIGLSKAQQFVLSPNNNWDHCTIIPAMIFVCNCRPLMLFSNFFQFPVPMIDANGPFKRFHNRTPRWWLKYNFLSFKEKRGKDLKHDLMLDDTLAACT